MSALSTYNPFGSPANIGLPDKFAAWSTGQRKAFDRALAALLGPKRFVVLAAPTGYGKSVVYMSVIKAMSQRALASMDVGDPTIVRRYRAAVVTASRGLQDQNLVNFGPPWDGVDVRGRGNYACIDYANLKCDHARYSCRSGMFCRWEQAFRTACESDLPMTNYAFWLVLARQSRAGLGERRNLKLVKDAKPFDLLVMDEAHEAEQYLASSLHIEIRPDELVGNGGLLFPKGWPTQLKPNLSLRDQGDWTREEWASWATQLSPGVLELIERKQAIIKAARDRITNSLTPAFLAQFFKLIALLDDLMSLEASSANRVVEVEEQLGHHQRIPVIVSDVIAPAEFAERDLFRRIPKILMTSATITQAGVSALNIDPSETEFIQLPNVFDLRRAPIWWLNGIRVSWRSTDDDLLEWLAKIDLIIDQYPTHKGIIHTSSYKLARFIMQHSRHVNRMVANDKAHETSAMVQRFRDSPLPQVFVSPSLTTGYDFQGDDCRFIIIAKLPLQQITSRITKARLAIDPSYVDAQVAQSIVQSAGRGMRGSLDWCATYIVDNQISWFYKRNRKFFPAWWALTHMGDDVPVLTPDAFS